MDVQILRVGQFVILCVPGEFTTMAGRRLRDAVADKVILLFSSQSSLPEAALSVGESQALQSTKWFRIVII